MLSVILLSHDVILTNEKRREGVVRSLASLVSCVVEGVIADAALVGPAAAGLDVVADEAGCHLIEAAEARPGLEEALACARCANVFVLAAGCAVEPGFSEAARDALTFGGFDRARVLRLAPDGLLTWLAPSLAQPAGLIARKESFVKARSATPRQLSRELRAGEFVARTRKCV
jgi:hypothetical protein